MLSSKLFKLISMIVKTINKTMRKIKGKKYKDVEVVRSSDLKLLEGISEEKPKEDGEREFHLIISTRNDNNTGWEYILLRGNEDLIRNCVKPSMLLKIIKDNE